MVLLQLSLKYSIVLIDSVLVLLRNDLNFNFRAIKGIYIYVLLSTDLIPLQG